MNDRQLSLFSEYELAKMISPHFPKQRHKAELRLKKTRLGVLRADISEDLELSEEGCPTMKPYFDIPDVPLIGFNEALASKEHDFWVHFFIDDYRFEQLWNPRYTQRDINILSEYKGMFSPDFTLTPSLSIWQEMFNVFRSRAIGQILQRRDKNVIPTLGWSNRKSFDFCFAGLSEGGTVAISTNGILKNIVSLRLFLEGVFELERQLRPDTIFVYGNKIELHTKAKQIWYPNTRIQHLRNQKADIIEGSTYQIFP